MATHSDFDRRRYERRRRERIRRKRIRALLMLIFLIIIIIVIFVSVSRCHKGSNVTLPEDENQVTIPQYNPDSEQQSSPGQDAVPSVSESAEASGGDIVPVTPVSTNALNIPPPSQENDLLEIIRDSGETKHCYLTFDDGPTENITPQILDTLRRYNVKATFFQIGSLIKANSDMARRVYEEGHLIANHSDGHNYAKLYVSTETFMNEINECYENIKEVTGEAEPFRLVRFPGGSFKSSADSYSPVKQECKTALKDYGFYYCDWNALNGDAEGRTKDADELFEYMVYNLDGEENVVVLMHDAAAKQATADALPKIIQYFIDEGYTFHRLDDIDYNASTAVVSSDNTVSSSSESADDEYNSDGYDSDYSGNSSTGGSSSGNSSETTSSGNASSTSQRSNSGGPIIIQ